MVEWYRLGKTDVLATSPTATLSTTNPTWIDPGPNPDLQTCKVTLLAMRFHLSLNAVFLSSLCALNLLDLGACWKGLQNILWTLVSSGMWHYVTELAVPAAWPQRWRHCSPSKSRTPEVTPLCEPQKAVQLHTNCSLRLTGCNNCQLTYDWVSLQLSWRMAERTATVQSEWCYSEKWLTR
jgi:hypothetical protein